MSAVSGIYRQGNVKLKELPDWADNAEVQVSLKSDQLGISEEEQGTDPESIAQWIAWYRSLEPLPGISDPSFPDNDEWYKKCGYYTPEQLKELEDLFK